MFCNCYKLKEIDVSHFDTQKAKSEMTAMFMGCRSLESLDLSGFKTANVTFMMNMFMNCSQLKTLDLSSFETTKVIASNGMFNGCSNLETVDLTNFTVEENNQMHHMFANCGKLTTIYCNHDWAAGKTFTEGQLSLNMAGMFEGCNKLIGGNGTTFDAQHIDVYYAHADAAGNPGYFTSKASGIEAATAGQSVKAQDYYCLDGRKGKSHGLNIVRMSDGSARKIIVKGQK
jgi:surface protein